LSALTILFHRDADAELDSLLDSEDVLEQRAGDQILLLLDLVQSHAQIRERILEHNKQFWLTHNGVMEAVDIKVIRQLQQYASDEKYLTDAIRRMRDLLHKPADRYRVFFAPTLRRNDVLCMTILGIFHRDIAYTAKTLEMLRRRYEE